MAHRREPKEHHILCRSARMSDMDEVMQIGDVFFGVDYLQYYYPKYMKDPNYYCYVCEVDGKVVGFRFICLINGGAGAESGGLRVHPDYRGLRVSKLLQEHATKAFSALHPRAFQKYFFTAFDNERTEKYLRTASKYQLIARGRLRSLAARPCDVLHFLERSHQTTALSLFEQIHYATEEQFLTEMERLPDSTRTVLFPHNLIDVFWKPLKLQPSNYKIICDLGQVFWTKDSTATDTRSCSIGPMLSCLRAIPCEVGLRVDHYLYGEDQRLLQSHVYAALSALKANMRGYKGSFEYILYYPLKMVVPDKDIFMEEIQWESGCYDSFKTHVAVTKAQYCKL